MVSKYLKIEDGRVVKPDGYQPSNVAHQKRLVHQRDVLDLGISPEILSDIVDEFYKRVLQHPMLASTFEEKIGANWDGHLAKMKSFKHRKY